MYHSVVGVGNVAYDNLCIIEDYPKEDSSTHILNIVNQGGGCVGSAMVCTSRLGESTSFIGNLGDDEAGRYIINDFIKEGVDISGITTIEGGRSSLGYVMIDPNKGTRTKFPYKDTLPDIEWTDDKVKQIQNAKILHIDGTQYNNCLEAALIAKEAGITISLDGCSKKEDNSLNVKLASLSDILIMNAAYPFYTSGLDNFEEAMYFFQDLGPKVIISTQGEKGCVALINGELKTFPAYKVNAIDTTGAGDAFHGAFVAATLKGYSLEEAIRYSSAVSACKCRQIGGRAGLPTHNEVLAFMADQ